MVFKIFSCLFVKNTKIKCLYASLKLVTNCENSSSDSLQGACSGVCQLPVTLKVVPKATCVLNVLQSRP